MSTSSATAAEALGEPDEEHADGGAGQAGVTGPAQIGQPDVRKTRVDLADDGDALVGEVEHRHRHDPEDDGDEWGRGPGHETTEQHDDRQRRDTDRKGAPLCLAEVGDQVPGLVEEVAVASRDTEQLGELSDDDGECEADDEPLQHRLGDERRQESQARQTGHDPEETDHDREAGGQRECVPVVSDLRDRRSGQCSGGGHRADHEVTGAPEHRVQDEGGGGGVQADDG